jgi:death on curing protein
MKYLYPRQVIALYRKIMEVTGGSIGLRDRNLFESAVFRPMATFDGKDLYPSLPEKAAALMAGIIWNHPFVDGNKRIAYEAMNLMLLLNGSDIKATEEEKYRFIMNAAKKEITEKEITAWIKAHSRK